jgi:hypothetical protein
VLNAEPGIPVNAKEHKTSWHPILARSFVMALETCWHKPKNNLPCY